MQAHAAPGRRPNGSRSARRVHRHSLWRRCWWWAALVLWVGFDHRAQRRLLADLEARGVTRRSADGSPHERTGSIQRTVTRRRLLVLLPLLVFLALAALFFFRLGSGDPSRIPSALIGQPAPDTQLAARCGPRSRRHAGAGYCRRRLQGRRDAGERLGLVVRAVPRRGAAADGARRGQAHPHRRHQLQGPAGQCAPLPRALRQSVRGGRRRRQRPRLDGLGRLRRAGDLRGRSRRQHRLQAGRPDHAGNLETVLKPEIEKALAAP